MRVLLADDHPSYRAGMRAMLEGDGICVVGEATNGRQAIELAGTLTPDIVLMDISMPLVSGIEATREIVRGSPEQRVLMLSASAEDSHIAEAIAAGAIGYLLKDRPVDELVGAVRQAVKGDTVVSGEVAALVLGAVRSQARASAPADADWRLTARELEVLRLIAAGSGNDAIGRALYISPNTAKQHVANIVEKLGANSRVQAAVTGVRAGLI